MKTPKPIKPFKSLEEEARFWETHDIAELMKNPMTPLDKLLPLEQEKTEVLTLRLQKSVKDRLDRTALLRGLNSSTLSRMWLIEKIREEEKEAARRMAYRQI